MGRFVRALKFQCGKHWLPSLHTTRYFAQYTDLVTDPCSPFDTTWWGWHQWCNRLGQCAPWHFSLGNFCWRTRKRGKEERERKNWKRKRKTMKMSWGPISFFFLFFVCLFFCLSLFETTENCLGFTKMHNFYQEKAYFTPGKVTLPLWNIFFLRHWTASLWRSSYRKIRLLLF